MLIGVLVWTALAGGSEPSDTYWSTVEANAPVAQYRFSDAAEATTLADAAGSDTAANSGIALAGEGPFGGSASGAFDGEAYATLTSDPLAGASEFTFEAWVDWAGGSSYDQPIFSLGSSATDYMYLTPASASSEHLMALEIHPSSGESVTITAPQLNSKEWHFVAVTETSSGALALYIDGALVSQVDEQAVAPAALATVTSSYLGKSLTGAPGFTGSLSNVAFYDKALTHSEIKAHYDSAEFPVDRVAPTISGLAEDGSELTAHAEDWSGLTPIGFSYQWKRCNASGEACTDISAAEEETYVAGHDDVDHTLRVEVKAGNEAGEGVPVSSAHTAEIAPAKPADSESPTITGYAGVGVRLSAAEGSWTGTPPLSYAYQWEACDEAGASCSAISGATESTYVLKSAQLGSTIRVVVTAENAAGSESATSDATAAVGPGVPVNTSPPTISGQPQEGWQLNSTAGEWTNEPTGFNFQWQDCDSSGEACVDKPESQNHAYIPQSEDVGHTIRLVVTAENEAGEGIAAASSPSPVIRGADEHWTYASQLGVDNVEQGLRTPTGLAADASGNLWVLDDNQVKEFDHEGIYLQRFGGGEGSGDGQLEHPEALAVDSSGNVWVDDTGNARIEEYSPTGDFIRTVGAGSIGPSKGIAVDSHDHIWVSDPENHRLVVFDDSGELLKTIEPSEPEPEEQYEPQGLGVAPNGHIWVVDAGAYRVEELDEDGSYLDSFGTHNNLPGSFEGPETLAIDSAGDVYVGERATHRIQEFDGKGRYLETVDTNLDESDFESPTAIAVSSDQKLWAGEDGSVAEWVYGAVEPPTSVEAPTISGVARETATLTAGLGTWSGTHALSYEFQWERCDEAGEACSPIEGASSSEYVPSEEDVGHTLRVLLTAQNSAGSASEISAPTSPVVAEMAPRNVGQLPSISGFARDGQTLTASSGEWSGEPTFVYTWQRCDSSGAGCVEIASATSETYELSSEDIGHRVRVLVSGENEFGSNSATSETTAVVHSAATHWNYASQLGFDGTEAGRFNYVTGLTADAAGHLWLLDHDEVKEFSSEGELLQRFGSEGSGEGQLSEPQGLAVDSSGNVWVADNGNERIDEFSAEGNYLRSVGEGLGWPKDVAIDSSGRIWFSDPGHERIVVLDEDGEVLKTLESHGPIPLGESYLPEGLAIAPDGKVWVADWGVDRVEQLDEEGTYLKSIATTSGSDEGEMLGPEGLALDSSGNLYVSEPGNARVQEFDEEGHFVDSVGGRFGSSWLGEGELFGLSAPQGVAVTSDGKLWASDSSRVTEWIHGTVEAPASLDPPSIAGASLEGTLLVAAPGSWSGTHALSYEFQWERCDEAGEACSPIEGMTSSEYAPSGEDVGHTLRVSVTAQNAAGSASAHSASTSSVEVDMTPRNVGASPSIAGFLREGQTVTVSNGEWSHEPTSFSYQWQSCDPSGEGCVDIPSATGTSYTLGSEDVGHALRVVVTGENASGSSSSTTAATVRVRAALEHWTYASEIGPDSVLGDFDIVTGLASDAAGHLWLLDHDEVKEFSSEGELLERFGSEGSGEGQLNEPRALTVDPSGDVWVADTGNRRVEEFSEAGEFIQILGEGTIAATGIAVDHRENVWASDPEHEQIVVFEAEGSTKEVESHELSSGQAFWPEELAVGPDGNVWVANVGADRAEEFDEEGNYLKSIAPEVGSGEGQINGPRSLAVDAEGDVYVGEPANARVQEFDEEGHFLDSVGGGPETGESFGWNAPGGIAITSDGKLWVADSSRVTEWIHGAVEAPSSVDAPSISGIPRESSLLTARQGSWSGTHALFYEFQWERCDEEGASCSPIEAVTSNSYAPSSADIGHTLRLQVTARNAAGSASATSPATPTIHALECTDIWTGGAEDGLWQSAGNWSSDEVPSAEDQACIFDASVSLTEGSYEVGSIIGEGSLAISGGSLELTDSSRRSEVGSLSLHEGSLSGAGSIDLLTAFTLEGNASMTGSGAIVIEPGAAGALNASSGCEPITLAERTLVNEGTFEYGWGTLMMSDGARLENRGTFDYDTGSVCYEPQIQVSGESSSAPAIVNLGTFKRTAEGTGGVGVDFDNSGSVEAAYGRLEFHGGVPEEVSTGTWTTTEGGSIAFVDGVFLIGEEVDLSQVEVEDATVERASSSGGPHGSLDPLAYASQTVTVSGHGHDGSAELQSVAIEVKPPGAEEWQPLCGPLIPGSLGEYECAWDTASGSYPDGSYQLRAQLTDDATPANTATTAAITVIVDNTAPSGSVSVPEHLEGLQSVSGAAADAGSGVATWQLQIAPEGSSEWSEACAEPASATGEGEYECSIETAAFSNGAYQLRALITDNAGNAYTTAAAATTIVNEPPVNTLAPSVSGTAERGQSLLASHGTWTGTQPLDYSYQWQRCEGSEGECTDIPGATASSYRVGIGDSGATLRVLVTATNTVGATAEASARTSAVAGPSCSDVWTGGASGSWSTAGNWSAGHAPSTSDAACIEAGTTVKVTSGSNAAGSLYDEGSLQLTGGSLELSDASKESSVSSLTIRNATLTGAGSLFVSDSFTFGASAAMSGSGETVVGPGVSGEIYASSGCEVMHLSERKLVNEGTLSYPWGTLYMSDGATIENLGTFDYDSEATCHGPQIQIPSESSSAPSIVNFGLFEKTSGSGTSTVAVPFANQGSVEAQRGTLAFSEGGVGEETAYGSWTAQSGASIGFSGGTFWISEDVDLSAVENEGATIELVAGSGPPVAHTPPRISGVLSVGHVLTASRGNWEGARPLTYTYQWQRCDASGAECTDISEANESTHLLTGDDYGSRLRVTVTATNSEGSALSDSSATARISFPPVNVSLPTISGLAQSGQTLSASAGSWEGGTTISYTYQWQLCTEGGGGVSVADAIFRSFATPFFGSNEYCEDIRGATDPTYTLQDAEIEDTVRVVVIATDADGETEAISEQSEVIIPATAPENVSPPGIDGTPQEGEQLEALNGRWDSPGSISYEYQWQRCNEEGEECADIAGATEATYTPGIEDLGARLLVVVTAVNGAGSATASSEPTDPVTQASAPTSTEAPTVTGSPKDGHTLSASTGSWDTPFPLEYSYQWQRCTGSDGESCSDISGATDATYTLSSADPPNSFVRVVVTAANPYEVTATSASSPTLIPASVRVTEYSYDANGNVESRTDGNDHTTTYAYGPQNEQTKVTEPDGSVAETGYDADGRAISQTDGNKHTTEYTRNVLGQVTEVTDPLGRKTSKTYDLAGHPSSVTDAAGRTTSYEYDAAGQLKEVHYSDGSTHAVEYEYDADGNRIEMVDGSGTSTSSFNQLDQLTEAVSGSGDTTAYEYNLAGQQTKLTYPNGKAVERSYDEDGRLASVEDWLGGTTSFAYDPDSNLTATTFPGPSDETDHYAYDDVGQMTGTDFDKGSEQISSLSYARNGEGQVAQTTAKGLPGEETTAYSYDEDSRLSKEGSTAYEYDAAGNLTKIGADTNAYDAAGQLEHSGSTNAGFDEVGQRTSLEPASGPATSYGYDQGGNLTSVTRPEAGPVAKIEDSYEYNGEGLRVGQTSGATSSDWSWDVSQSVPLLLDDGTLAYVYGPSGLPIEQINGEGEVQYLHHDQSGSTRLITGSEGANEGAFTYNAYGKPIGSSGSAETPLGYDGQYTNADTGLQYLRARSYEPATGQFLSVDPLVGFTREPYGFVNGDPLSEGDATGLCGFSSLGDFGDCFDPVSSGNVFYKGAVGLKNVTGGVIDLPWLLTQPAVVDAGALLACAAPVVDTAICPPALGAAWTVSSSSVVARGIETGWCNPGKLIAEEGVNTLLLGSGALGYWTAGAAGEMDASGLAMTFIRGGPVATQGLLDVFEAKHGG